MRKTKRMIAMIIAIVMLLAFIPFKAFATEYGEGNITLQISLDADDNNFSAHDVKVNGLNWTNGDNIYRSNTGDYVVSGQIHSENGSRPRIIYGGNVRDYMENVATINIGPAEGTDKEYDFSMELPSIGVVVDDEDNLINFLGLRIGAEEEHHDGNNVPEDTICNVDFGTASWEIKGKTVTASVEGKTLTNGPVDITVVEKIKLTGYDALTMEPIIEIIDDGFMTRLTVNENGETSIMDKQVESLRFEEPKANYDATINLSSSSAYAKSYENAIIDINGYPINDQIEFGEKLPASNTAHYYYNPSENDGKVRFQFSTLFIDQYVGDIKINGQTFNVKNDLLDYSDRTAWLNHYGHQMVTLEVDVDRASTYDIEVNIAPAEGKNQWIGNFLWTDAEKDKDTDLYIGHSTLELVKVEYELDLNGDDRYDNNEKFVVEAKDVKNDPYIEYNPYGEVGELVVPEGALCTMKITPEYGYQVVSFGMNGTTIIAEDEVSEFTFPIHKGNFHLGAEVERVEDVVNAKSGKIESGEIKIDSKEIDSGSVVLSVDDVELDDTKTAKFEEAAGEYTINQYLDIDLDKVVYKGTADNVWSERIHELKNDATITLKLEQGIDGNNIVIVHNVDDGEEYEIIEIESYDPETNTITFKTNSFSNYAIASKVSEEEEENTEEQNENENNIVVTNDNITLSFVGEGESSDYKLEITDFANVSDELLSALEMTREQYNEAVEKVKEAVKKYGELVLIYDISVIDKDGNNVEKGEFDIKIPLTEELKKFNTFKLLNINDDLKVAEVIELTIEGNFLVGKLPHLSAYVLVGENVEENSKTNNPTTGDNIFVYVVIFAVATVCAVIMLTKNKKKTKSRRQR